VRRERFGAFGAERLRALGALGRGCPPPQFNRGRRTQLHAVKLAAVGGSARAACFYSTGVNTTGARPISLISPIIRIIWWGTQRSIGGAPSSRVIVNLAKTGWLKSIRAHARMSRTSLGGLPDGGFLAKARNSLASCGDRSGRRRTKYLLCRTAIFVLYALALANARIALKPHSQCAAW
jgi:hypothetical protein